jgi:mannobiose 2-epimerase
MTCQDEYLEASVSVWDFIRMYLVDKQHGEWFWKVDGKGVPDYHQPKICNWKGPYHNVRTCIEVINRIDTLLAQYTQQKGTYTYG